MSTRIAIAASLALGCGGGADPVDCAVAAAFTTCEVEGAATAMCVEGACTALEPRGTEPWGPGPTFRIPDTALGECQGPDGTIACPGSAGAPDCGDTALCGQDAQYGWDVAHDRSDRFSGDGAAEFVVTDAVTGLQWMGCARGQGEGCAGTALRGDWDEAVRFCTDSTWGGHDDWQLPSAASLHSIVDYSTTSPAIDGAAFPNAPSLFATDDQEWWKECVWSSTEYVNDNNVVWASMVNSGDVLAGSGVPYHSHDKAAADWEGCYARCVRAHPVPAHRRFLSMGDAEPVVVDTVGQRTWAGCSIGQSGSDCTGTATPLAWADALSACESLDWGGHDDWRLPDIMELRSIVDLTQFRPAIDPMLFPNTPYYTGGDNNNEGQYWTSTARWYNGFALYVSFHDGGNHFYVQDELRHARCVR